MMHLQHPDDAGDEHFASIWAEERWRAYCEEWTAANAAYRDAGGDPWLIEPLGFDDQFVAGQRALWERYRKDERVVALRHIRLPSCPMCGSQTTGSVDHYLPRETFAEFSVLFENLVPACGICNSAGKGKTYRGGVATERFIHPYYDLWAADPVWKVDIEPPFEAPTFSASPIAGLAAPILQIVAFHLKQVLSEQWLAFNERTWGALPERLLGRAPNHAPANSGSVLAALDGKQWDSDRFDGNNSWGSALLRGIRENPGALAHLADRTAAVAQKLIA